MNEIMPFLENVLRGKNVSEERKKEVAHHYEMFGGVSPINAQNRELIALLKKKFETENIDLPIFWGNRNWSPYLKDAFQEMKTAGVSNVLAYFTSAYGSYSGCRQYFENIADAQKKTGTEDIHVERLPLFFDHPDFIQVNVQNIQSQMQLASDEVHLAFTAHSIPVSMTQTSPYLTQLRQACELVARKVGIQSWELVYQSRSGPPQVPWLEPDICDHLEAIAKKGVREVIISPIGFVSDHMEVKYDLDVEAKQKAGQLGIKMYRAASAGNDALMIDMITSMVRDRIQNQKIFACKSDCCPNPRR